MSVKKFLATLALSIITLTPSFALASGLVVPPVDLPNDLSGVMMNIINYILGFITIIAVLMLIWGGIQYLTAAGDEAQVEGAKHTITYAIIGLVIVGISYAIVVVVVNTWIGGLFS